MKIVWKTSEFFDDNSVHGLALNCNFTLHFIVTPPQEVVTWTVLTDVSCLEVPMWNPPAPDL